MENYAKRERSGSVLTPIYFERRRGEKIDRGDRSDFLEPEEWDSSVSPGRSNEVEQSYDRS